MKKLTISADLSVFDSEKDLSDDVQELIKQAASIRDRAYSPYSKFQVGAAILLDNGEVITGSNQENASFPAGLCAERTAIFYAGANFPDARILKLVISAKSLNYSVTVPTPPCGSCRQAIAEYEVKQETPIQIYFMGESGKIVMADSISDLLPLIFNNSYL